MEISEEKMTSTTKSLESIRHKLSTDAPNTLRIPISFVRCSAKQEANQNKPKQLMNMARVAKKPANVPMRSSEANFAA